MLIPIAFIAVPTSFRMYRSLFFLGFIQHRDIQKSSLSTSDNSVVVVNTVTADMTDVDCRARISSPIVAMTFAPNGRFLACFTQSSILTVISTSFETKVLDFDTSEGSSAPPLDMKWCGEDRYDSVAGLFGYGVLLTQSPSLPAAWSCIGRISGCSW